MKETKNKNQKESDNSNLIDLVKETVDLTVPYLKNDSFDINLISTGFPSLDLILGGGFAEGRIVSLAGLEGTGKSSFAQQIMGNIQKRDSDFIFVYLDVEATCSSQRFNSMGIDINNRFIYKQPRTIEEFWNLINGLIEAQKVLQKKTGKKYKYIVTLDTVAALQTNAMYEEERFDKEMAGRARVWSSSLGRFTKTLTLHNITPIFINQLRADMNANNFFGPQYDTPGGMALKFYPFQIIHLSEKEVSKKENVEKGVKIITVVTTKNKAYRPMIKMEMVFDYERGYIEPLTELRYLQNEKVIKKVPGGTFNIVDDEIQKIFQSEKMPTEIKFLEAFANDDKDSQALKDNLIKAFTLIFNKNFQKIRDLSIEEEGENELKDDEVITLD